METVLVVAEASQIAQARRHALSIAASCAFSEEAAGRVALIVTEAGTNLIKYAGGGYMIIRVYIEAGVEGVEIIALDRGPGISDQSMVDGHSTGGSLGLGMGAIVRLASFCEIYTAPGCGTAILARISPARMRLAAPAPVSVPALVVGGVSTPKPGQEACGDAWAEKWCNGTLWVAAIDGLGHGPQAAIAAAQAVRAFHAAAPHETPQQVIWSAHEALKTTRGAVMAVAAIHPQAGRVDFAGVGNISAVLIGPDATRRLASMDGTVGYSVRSVREQAYPWASDSTLVLASDGISSRWNLSAHAGLVARHPSLVAAVLHRDFDRQNDDTTVMVIKDTAV